ncbi:MAG: ferritin-like domain-containing protein [Defluviitaleaceae bacterium]|nr:ferritin-like domain-containing protein [Defluviitaleaceae bacterium]
MSLSIHQNHVELTDKSLLEIINQSISNKVSDIEYYTKMSKNIVHKNNQDMLREIATEETKQQKLLTDIYLTYTKKMPKIEQEYRHISNNFTTACKDAYQEELKRIEFYKSLYQMIKNVNVKDIILDMIIEEQLHCKKLLFMMMP